MIAKLKENAVLTITAIGVFVGIWIFFTTIHPVVPYDADDWLWLSTFRHPIPDPAVWDPSRIMAELITPISALFSAFVIFPLTKSYMGSYIYLVALFMSVFSTILYVTLYRLFYVISKSKPLSILCCIFMGIFFFGFFKTRQDSLYMLHSSNYTCVFAYTVPNLLNSILVCTVIRWTFEEKEISIKGIGIKKLAILIVLSYFSIFSILFSGAILVVYCGYEVLIEAAQTKKLDIKKNIFYVCAIGAFLVYCVFEMTGKRATMNVNDASREAAAMTLSDRLDMTLSYFQNLMNQVNALFVIFVGAVIFGALVVLSIRLKEDQHSKIIRCAGICAFSGITLVPAFIIVSLKAGPNYPGDTQTMYGMFFYLFLVAAMAIIYIIQRYKALILVLPLIFAMFAAETMNAGYHFDDQYDYSWYVGQLSTKKKIEFNNMWIGEIITADQSGMYDVTLHVPKYEFLDQLPHPRNEYGPSYYSTSLATVLRLHNLVSKPMNINLEYVDGMLMPNPPDPNNPPQEASERK